MPEEPHEHDLGLRHDLPRMLDRRRLLQVVSVVGVATLVGCSNDDSGSSTASATTGSTSTTSTTSDGATDRDPIPEETAGPYPGDGTNGPNALAEDGIVRSDIRSSFGSSTTTAGGVPMAIDLTVLDTANGSSPLSGAAVYVWHCDREARYSMYSAGAESENYLRGVQETDASGRVSFQSIFPAAYTGRWPHIHFEVYESLEAATAGGTLLATSQVALPEDVCNEVYATEGYEQSVATMSETSLTSDMVFGDDGGASQLGSTTGSVADGYAVALTVPV